MQPITSFAQILAPVTEETFRSEFLGRKPLHIPADAPDKLAGVMGWPDLSAILSQAGNWSSATLELVLDHNKVPIDRYCRPGRSRDGRDAMMADLEQVRSWLRRGASLVLNDIDSLTPGLRAAADTLETATGGKVQANLYCSWKAHPAFHTHFDMHDVYALHMAGEKTWRLYRRTIENPISHPSFRSFGQAFHDEQKGPVTQTVTLRPGDVLYIPRGWYHDALASSEATFHVAFGVTPMIGLDLMSMLFEAAVQDPLFRKGFPPRADRGAVTSHLAALGDRLAAAVRDPKVVDQVLAAMADFRYRRGAITLPDEALVKQWQRRTDGLSVRTVQGRRVLTDGRQGVPVPDDVADAVVWVLDRAEPFGEADLATVTPTLSEAARAKLIADLQSMRVIVQA